MSEKEKRARIMSELMKIVVDPPSSEVQALGMLMKHWLETEMSDNGSAVDSGGGMGQYDLWVKFGGEELYISIKQSKGDDINSLGENP